jgi:hypothetical protein
VREEHRHLVQYRPAPRLGLLAGSIDAHNDVAEHVAGERAELALVHGERENVGGPIFMPIDLVQLMDVFVVG